MILAHERQDRVRFLARHLAEHQVRVVVHLDRRIRADALENQPDITLIQTQASDWGRFGLVQAALDASKLALKDTSVSHVYLLSGSCLPIRPVGELIEHLAAHPGRDFIESVDISDDKWVEDGLSEERFTLWHPFSHRHSPRLFSASVDVQRMLRIRRRIPDGLQPRLGAQWWCLSAETLNSLLADPRLPAWRRFFRSTWIPDESFFQTVVPVVAAKTALPTLTFSRFDPRGKPYVFHDDHLQFLSAQDAYVARKIDPDAGALYEGLLRKKHAAPPLQTDCKPIAACRAQELSEGKGLLAPGRYPGGTNQSSVETACPYAVLVAEDGALLDRLHDRLRGLSGISLHGQLFAPDSVPLAQEASVIVGTLSAEPKIRAYRPSQFLQRLVWAERHDRTGFFYRPTVPAPEAGQIVGDGNARLLLIGDGIDLLKKLRRPMPAKRRWRFKRRVVKPRALWAWTRTLDPVAVQADLEGGGSTLDLITSILKSDWYDPTGWVVPEGTKLTAARVG